MMYGIVAISTASASTGDYRKNNDPNEPSGWSFGSNIAKVVALSRNPLNFLPQVGAAGREVTM